MNKKLMAACFTMVVLSSFLSHSFAQEIVVNGCNHTCQGHVFAGTDRIRVVSGSHYITLDGVCIDVADQNNTAAFAIEQGAEVVLTLINKNALKSGAGCAGIQGPDGAVLTITEASTGMLDVVGGMKAAGIGGGSEEDSGIISIRGGFVNARGQGEYGSESGAGIGGGYKGDGANITISGGVIEAMGGTGAAGIGGGYSGSGYEISITGGIINARSSCDYISGAGIGGGAGGVGERISIEGGFVTANTYYCEGATTGAGIGGGMNGEGGFIAIHGGLVYASAGSDAAGIGSSGDGWDSGDIEINGGFVVAYGGEWGGAGIGRGCVPGVESYNRIQITGGVTIAEGGYTQNSHPGGAGIGGCGGRTNNLICIMGGYVHATAGEGGNYGGAGIGSGGAANAGNIYVKGGRIIADAGIDDETTYGGAGIGSGGNALADGIMILGGKVSATGRGNGAGIGDGERGSGKISIHGGSVVAYNGNADTDAIAGELEYTQGEVISNGKVLNSNAEPMDDWNYVALSSWYD